MLTAATRLEVWGDPIAHSLSPSLHAAAYRTLGLDWSYGRRRVDAGSFATVLASLGPELRGLSLTMPLKVEAFRAARAHDRRGELTGAVNTLLLTPDGPYGVNTDVGGIVRALRDEGLDAVASARIVGAGATATSALVALAEMRAERVEVVARRPEAGARLAELGTLLGVDVSVAAFDAATFASEPLTIATLPGDAPVADPTAAALAASGGLLYDVVYGHWPTRLAVAWQREGAPVAWGLGMLVQQALLQVRVFVAGDAETELPDEAAVLAAMHAVVA